MTDTNGTSEKIREAASMDADELRELGRELRQRANDVRKEVAKQLNNAAETIRKEVHDAKIEGDTKTNAHEVAKGLERAATYLNNRSVEDMGKEATRVVRKNPMRAVIVAFVIGLLMGIMMRGSKD